MRLPRNLTTAAVVVIAVAVLAGCGSDGGAGGCLVGEAIREADAVPDDYDDRDRYDAARIDRANELTRQLGGDNLYNSPDGLHTDGGRYLGWELLPERIELASAIDSWRDRDIGNGRYPDYVIDAYCDLERRLVEVRNR